jgi:hypothetical protein
MVELDMEKGLQRLAQTPDAFEDALTHFRNENYGF